MKIAIIGASGFIGKALVPFLRAKGISVNVVGRDLEKLLRFFPDSQAFSLTDMSSAFKNCDAVINLAVLNNDSEREANLDEFREINVKLVEKLFNAATKAGVKRFIHFSTLHIQFADNENPYANSKAEAERLLEKQKGIDTTILRLAAVYGTDQNKGKLTILNRVPKFLRPVLVNLLSALRPTVSLGRVCETTFQTIQSQPRKVVYVSNSQFHNPFYFCGKWVLDWIFAVFVAVFLAVPLLLVYIAVRLTSAGPGLFVQERLGKNQKVFRCFKFRTMAVGTKQAGTHEVSKSSVTNFGRFLRKTKLDELPQILNIFSGTLSLVGPRPGLPSQETLTASREARGIYKIKPGITGLAQIRNIDMSTPEKLASVDAEYIAKRTLILDCKIILATALGKGQGDIPNS